MTMRSSSLGGLILLVGCHLLNPAWAGVADVTDRIRQQAIQACSSDALRLCPAALPDEQSTIACMAGKRNQLEPRCRDVYDRVARLLRH